MNATPSEETLPNIWASFDVDSDERMRLVEMVERIIDLNNVAHGTTLGTARISGDNIELNLRQSIIDDYGLD